MASLIYKVEGLHSLEGHGQGLIGFSPEQYQHLANLIGKRVDLKLPDGTMMRVNVQAVEYPPGAIYCGKRPRHTKHAIYVELPLHHRGTPSEQKCGLSMTRNKAQLPHYRYAITGCKVNNRQGGSKRGKRPRWNRGAGERSDAEKAKA